MSGPPLHPTLADRLAELTALDAPTGFEEPVLRFVRDALADLCDDVQVDVRGNVYGRIESPVSNALRVMLTAHADEIGLLVTHILPGGFLRFSRLGQPTVMVLPGQRVRVLTSTGPISAVVGVKPGHVLSSEEARRTPAVEQMYLDVGSSSAEEAVAWGIEPGTPVVFDAPLTRLHHDDRWFGKAVDNRAGVLCVLEAARSLSESRPTCTVEFVITVEEEIGLRGAEVAARRVQPDVVLSVDTVPAGGTPDLRPDELPWTIGAGPLLKVRETRGLSTQGPLRQLVREAAEELQISYQLIVDTAGITDGTAAQQASGDVAAMVLGLARRYSHSAVELVDLRDLEGLIALSVAVIHRLQNRSQLQRLI
ncbi:MAG: M42 family metallopeptidase [Planctomycetaceae bacterium]